MAGTAAHPAAAAVEEPPDEAVVQRRRRRGVEVTRRDGLDASEPKSHRVEIVSDRRANLCTGRGARPLRPVPSRTHRHDGRLG